MEMKKILSISLLQFVVFIKFGRTNVDAIIVEGCVESQLSLICNETKVINILDVVLGNSGGYAPWAWCIGTSCCPKPYDETAKPNDNHVNEVHIRCNEQRNCTVNVIKEKDSDFERITYECIVNGSLTTATLHTTLRTSLPATRSKSAATFNSISPTSGIPLKPFSSDEIKSTTSTDILTDGDVTMPGTELMPIIVAIICLVVFVIIIVVIIVIIKRKKTSSKIISEVEMTEARNGIYANQDQDANGNPNSSASRQNDGQKCASVIYAEPNNVVEYSVVSQEKSPAAEGGAGVEYSSIDIIKSDHKAPAAKSEDDGYSLAGDPDDARQSTCVENLYEDVESKQPDSKAKSANIRGGAYEEPIKVMGQAASSGQSNLQQKHPPSSKSDKSASNAKVDEGIYKNIGEVGSPLSSPSSPYEPMTPISGQNVYANESAVPFRTESLTSSLGSGSEAHTPYCEMRSPSVKLKDDGAHMLVDNELYSQ